MINPVLISVLKAVPHPDTDVILIFFYCSLLVLTFTRVVLEMNYKLFSLKLFCSYHFIKSCS